MVEEGRSMAKGTEVSLRLEQRVNNQIASFVDILKDFNSILPKESQRSERDYKFLQFFFKEFIKDRDNRAKEVSSPEYRKILEKANSMLRLPPFAIMCMDGRVKMVHAFGFSADIGSSMRVAAGNLKEFVRGQDGKLMLNANSNFAELLDNALMKNEAFLEIFDSHWGCAAREKEEIAHGAHPGDAGLYSDVLHKKEMIKASRAYILNKEEYGKDKQVVFAQTTFNPLTGFMYMGLETDDALRYAEDVAKEKANNEGKPLESAVPVYSKEIVKYLIENNKVISTGQLIENEIIRKKMDEAYFKIDRKKDYIKATEQFWDGVSKIKDELLPIFKRSLKNLYTELSHEDPKTERELEAKAMLLLCSTYNGYLHNKTHNEMDYLSVDDEHYESQGHYEYDHHNEEGIKISEGGYPPYYIPMFVIYSGDLQKMPDDIETASDIVRKNRKLGRIKDASGTFTNPEEYESAPVPMVMQEIVRDPRITPEEWKMLEEADWSGDSDGLPIPDNWYSMKERQFRSYLGKKLKLTGTLEDAIVNLREKMITIFDPNSSTANHLISQYKVALPLICDQYRKTHVIVPFFKSGYKQSDL